MPSAAYKLIPADFTPAPSLIPERVVDFEAVTEFSPDLDAVGITVASDGPVDPALGLDREALARAGFEGKPGQTLLMPNASGPLRCAVGAGAADEVTVDSVRDTAASFARAASSAARIGLRFTGAGRSTAEAAGQAAAEGILLARYRYSALKTEPDVTALGAVELIVDGEEPSAVAAGIPRGVITARAANLARDLANTPPAYLTATDFADLAEEVAEQFGLQVEVADKARLIELGCGGLLGVNAGSAEEPRMITLRYTPDDPTGRLAMVGKGIMYDSGGISLKPSDPMHLLMKMDMGGAAAIFGALTALRDLGCTTEVTAFLMCTDNMPSGSAYKLGDVLTARGGTTIEVKNTDAEGRLAMCDGLVLATEEHPDAILDIATLTGAALVALGPARAPVFGNDQAIVDQVLAAASATDEQLWQLPLEKKYRKQLDSDIADISNLGGPFAGATTAALFLNEFVAGIPWAHVDIAGTMQSEADDTWRSKGATGFGARLITEVALRFRPPSQTA